MKKRRGRGEGAIERLPNGTWRVRLSVVKNGKRTRPSVTAPSKKELLEKLEKLRQEPTKVKSGVTWAQLFEQFAASLDRECAPLTVIPLRGRFKKYIAPAIGEKDVCWLDTARISSLMAGLEESETPRPSLKRVASLLKRLCEFARAKGLETVAASDIGSVRTEEAVHEVWSQSEANQFLTCMRAREDFYYPFYLVALDTGARFGELRALTKDDVDLNRGVVSITKSTYEVAGRIFTKETKTRKGKRNLRLSSKTLEELKKYWAWRSRKVTREPYFFLTKRGSWIRRSNFDRQYFKPAMRRAGVKAIRFHDLRHTCATLLLQAKVPLKAVSERLGHADVRTTLHVYAHVLPEQEQEAANVFDRMFKEEK